MSIHFALREEYAKECNLAEEVKEIHDSVVSLPVEMIAMMGEYRGPQVVTVNWILPDDFSEQEDTFQCLEMPSHEELAQLLFRRHDFLYDREVSFQLVSPNLYTATIHP